MHLFVLVRGCGGSGLRGSLGSRRLLLQSRAALTFVVLLLRWRWASMAGAICAALLLGARSAPTLAISTPSLSCAAALGSDAPPTGSTSQLDRSRLAARYSAEGAASCPAVSSTISFNAAPATSIPSPSMAPVLKFHASAIGSTFPLDRSCYGAAGSVVEAGCVGVLSTIPVSLAGVALGGSNSKGLPTLPLACIYTWHAFSIGSSSLSDRCCPGMSF